MNDEKIQKEMVDNTIQAWEIVEIYLYLPYGCSKDDFKAQFGLKSLGACNSNACTFEKFCDSNLGFEGSCACLLMRYEVCVYKALRQVKKNGTN